MDLPINKVRFIMSPVGGGFGGKEGMIYQGMLALCAMKTRLPVRYVMTREEDITSTAKRHPSRTNYKIGITKDGKITYSYVPIIEHKTGNTIQIVSQEVSASVHRAWRRK